jgi:hypothetical protein
LRFALCFFLMGRAWAGGRRAPGAGLDGMLSAQYTGKSRVRLPAMSAA